MNNGTVIDGIRTQTLTIRLLYCICELLSKMSILALVSIGVSGVIPFLLSHMIEFIASGFFKTEVLQVLNYSKNLIVLSANTWIVLSCTAIITYGVANYLSYQTINKQGDIQAKVWIIFLVKDFRNWVVCGLLLTFVLNVFLVLSAILSSIFSIPFGDWKMLFTISGLIAVSLLGLAVMILPLVLLFSGRNSDKT